MAASPVTSRPGRPNSATPSPVTSTNGPATPSRRTTLPEETDPLDKQQARYAALKAARDRALVFVLAYTAVRFRGTPPGPERPAPARRPLGRTSRSTTGAWTFTGRNSGGTPPVSPTRRSRRCGSYRQLMDPPTERWPVFPTFDQRTLAGLIRMGAADRGERPDASLPSAARSMPETSCWRSTRIFGRRRSQQTAHGRFSSGSPETAEVDIDHRNTTILLPAGPTWNG